MKNGKTRRNTKARKGTGDLKVHQRQSLGTVLLRGEGTTETNKEMAEMKEKIKTFEAGDTHFPKHSLEYSLNFWSRSKKMIKTLEARNQHLHGSAKKESHTPDAPKQIQVHLEVPLAEPANPEHEAQNNAALGQQPPHTSAQPMAAPMQNGSQTVHHHYAFMVPSISGSRDAAHNQPNNATRLCRYNQCTFTVSALLGSTDAAHDPLIPTTCIYVQGRRSTRTTECVER